MLKAKPASPNKARKPGRRSPPAQIRGPVPAEDDIYRAVTKGIVDKTIRPGTRLKEAALAGEYAVSRARIRRVLRRLAELSVIEFRLNIGAVVSRPSADEVARGIQDPETARERGGARSHQARRQADVQTSAGVHQE